MADTTKTAPALQALIEVRKLARHPDYDWPPDLAKEVDELIARAAAAQDAPAEPCGRVTAEADRRGRRWHFTPNREAWEQLTRQPRADFVHFDVYLAARASQPIPASPDAAATVPSHQATAAVISLGSALHRISTGNYDGAAKVIARVREMFSAAAPTAAQPLTTHPYEARRYCSGDGAWTDWQPCTSDQAAWWRQGHAGKFEIRDRVMLLTDDDMAKSLAAAIDLPTVYEAAAFRKGFMAAQRALLAKLREQQPVCDLAAGWIAGRAETYAEVYSSNTLAEAYQAGAEFALRSKVLHAAAPAPTPAPVGAQEREHVDCIGLALDLEARAKTVESQTTERAMRAAAHGLRLLAARSAAQAAQAVPADMAEGWSVTVSLHGVPELIIGSTFRYSGIGDLDRATIVGCAQHLLAWPGVPRPVETQAAQP